MVKSTGKNTEEERFYIFMLSKQELLGFGHFKNILCGTG